MLQWGLLVVDSHTPGVALPTFAVDPLGMAQSQFRPDRVWRAGIWHVYSGRAHECPIKKWDRAVDPKSTFWEKQKMAPKNPRGGTLTLEFFRMLKFDDFISYSSNTTKIYMKNMGGSARNTIVEKLAILGSKGPPLGVSIFRSLKFFLILCFLWWGPHMDCEYIVSLKIFSNKFFSTSEGPRVPLGCQFFDRWNFF